MDSVTLYRVLAGDINTAKITEMIALVTYCAIWAGIYIPWLTLIGSFACRFLVRGKRDKFEILEIRPTKHFTVKLKQNYHFFGKETLGIVTRVAI